MNKVYLINQEIVKATLRHGPDYRIRRETLQWLEVKLGRLPHIFDLIDPIDKWSKGLSILLLFIAISFNQSALSVEQDPYYPLRPKHKKEVEMDKYYPPDLMGESTVNE